MKKIVSLLALILTIALFSGDRLSAQNEMAGKDTKPTSPGDSKSINKPNVTESKVEAETIAQKNSTDSRPGILFILSKDEGQVGWSPSLWWSYKHSRTVQPGC
jgi:hypothetical protein